MVRLCVNKMLDSERWSKVQKVKEATETVPILHLSFQYQLLSPNSFKYFTIIYYIGGRKLP